MTNDESLERLQIQVANILEEAKRQGADAAEVGVSEDLGLSVTARMGEVETIEYHRDRGFGITVFFGKRKGNASTSDGSDAAVRDTVRAACNLARFTAEDPFAGLAELELLPQSIPDLDLFHPWSLDAEAASELAKECEAAALRVAGITNSEGGSVGTYESRRVYGNSLGFIGAYRGTRHSISCAAIAGEGVGMQRDFEYSTNRRAELLQPGAWIGAEAARKALARLNPQSAKSGAFPILLEPGLAAGLLGSFLSAISGGSLYRRASFLLNSMGEQVFPEHITIDERPLLPGFLGSASFDGDGVATRAKAFVERGVVRSYALSIYSARKLGLAPTGNGGGFHNVFVAHSEEGAEQLLRKMGTGLWVTELMGQGVNLVTGDYSRGAAGFWVERGQIQYPVDEVTIAGNLRDMFKHIVAIGNDLDYRRNFVCGSLLLEGVTIASA